MPKAVAALALDMTLSLWRGYGVQYVRVPSRLRELRKRGDQAATAWQAMLESAVRRGTLFA